MIKYPATLIMRGFRNWLQDDDVHQQRHRNKIIERILISPVGVLLTICCGEIS